MLSSGLEGTWRAVGRAACRGDDELNVWVAAAGTPVVGVAMRGIDMATAAAGVADGERQVVKANQRDRMREMLDRNGVLPPEPQQEAALAPVLADLEQIAADEQEQMEGYHGLTTDDASGMKMFCALPISPTTASVASPPAAPVNCCGWCAPRA